jgi:hypothetical protein
VKAISSACTVPGCASPADHLRHRSDHRRPSATPR